MSKQVPPKQTKRIVVADSIAKDVRLSLDTIKHGDKIRVIRPAGQLLQMDQIVTVTVAVKDVVTHHGKSSGIMVDYGNGKEPDDEDNLIVWDIDRFVKFV